MDRNIWGAEGFGSTQEHESRAVFARMPTRNVVLTDHQQEVIESLVGSGRYQNASELEALRQAAAIGWRDLDAGRYRDVGEDGLVDYIGQLGARASKQVRARG